MSTEVERIEQYLRGIAVPEYVSEPHRQQLRRRILGEVRTGRTTALPSRTWKLAAAAAVLVGLGGIVGIIIEMGSDAAGRKPGGDHQLVSQGALPVYTISTSDANVAADAQQTETDLAVLDLLRRQNAAKLVRVIESEVNGRLDSRTLVHRYTLPDGRVRTIGEGDRDYPKAAAQMCLTTAAWTEIDQLRQTGKAERLGPQEKEVKGREFVFNRERYTLRDGTEVILSVGEPKETESPQR
ncbi:MAG: hypothetical protein FJ280_00165 [Planctomycetes bacterium]|nr:hypothetical protein [Planctomycetota bacterium]